MSGRCGACACELRAGRTFQFQSGGEPRLRCWICALVYGPMVRRSLIIALVVGSVLMAINHGDAILGGQLNRALVWKAPLTYLVPFLVASCGALLNSRLP